MIDFSLYKNKNKNKKNFPGICKQVGGLGREERKGREIPSSYPPDSVIEESNGLFHREESQFHSEPTGTD